MSSVLAAPMPIFLDTSFIRGTGFAHPDFQKLIEYSKRNLIRLFVSFIVWEEFRTQELAKIDGQAQKARSKVAPYPAMIKWVL